MARFLVAVIRAYRYALSPWWGTQCRFTPTCSQYALDAMRNRFGDRIHVHGPSGTDMRGGIVSFGFDHIHAHDISQVLDEDAICVRASHHCAKPLMRRLAVAATARASLYVYNDEADVDALADALDSTADLFLTP